MLHPLVSLWRHSCRVTFYENGGALYAQPPRGSGDPLQVLRRFRGQDEALSYLAYWAGNPGAQADLRWLVQRLGSSVAGSRQGPTPWLEPLAGMLASGALTVFEETARSGRPGRLAPAPSGSAGAASAAALDDLPPLSSLPAIPVVPDLLPALEDIQIEGAEVLPELDEAMAEVEATLATIDAAGVSLEPAPSKVGDIGAALKTAAADSAAGLDQA